MSPSFIPKEVWSVLFVLVSLFGWVSACYWWRRYNELLRRIRDGGYVKPPAFTITKVPTGMEPWTGEVTPQLTTEVTRLMSVPGFHLLPGDFLETLPKLLPHNKPSSPGGYGRLTVVDGGETSGPTQPENVA